MKIDYSEEKICFEKKLNELDRFTLSFAKRLDDLKIKYVLVSGYVSILFGRSRSSEDIDMIIEEIDFDKFKVLWNGLYKEFECLNTENMKSAYEEYLKNGQAIRFSKKNKFIPNMEVKFPKIELDQWTLVNRRRVELNDKILYISPIELQIPFKLFLGKGGNEKDIEDAKYLYEIFKENVDLKILDEFNRKLKIKDLFDRYLR